MEKINRNKIETITMLLRTEKQRDELASKIPKLPIDEDHPIQITISEEKNKRTLPQNNIMWGMLGDISKQVEWYGMMLLDHEWKDIFTASLKKQKVAPGLDGGFVVLGARTSEMKVKEMIDMITLMQAFGVEKNVKFKAYGYEEERAF